MTRFLFTLADVYRVAAIPPLDRRHGGIGRCNECKAPACKAQPRADARFQQFADGQTRDA